MHAAPNQTSTTHNIIRLGVRFTPYSNGFVIAQYRSTDIAHRFNIDAVQLSTSNDTHISQKTVPKFHLPSTSYNNAVGITNIATHKSDTANDTNR